MARQNKDKPIYRKKVDVKVKAARSKEMKKVALGAVAGSRT